MNKVLLIAGPTASGKTALALNLALKYDGELVSADSRQIFRGMDIGTGKDLPSDKKVSDYRISASLKNHNYILSAYLYGKIPLWLYDVVNPDEDFSVSHYRALADTVISDIIRRGKLPVVVGGSGFYIRSLFSPPETLDIPQNPDLRKKTGSLDVSLLQQYLKKLNSEALAGMNHSDRHNPRRLVRKIETEKYMQENKVSSVSKKINYNLLKIGLNTGRKQLEQKIIRRIEDRMERGILQEIEKLQSEGYGWNLRSMNSLGYGQWRSWFENPGKRTPDLKSLCLKQWKKSELAYARQQVTWFKKDPGIVWFDTGDSGWDQKVMEMTDKWYTDR